MWDILCAVGWLELRWPYSLVRKNCSYSRANLSIPNIYYATKVQVVNSVAWIYILIKLNMNWHISGFIFWTKKATCKTLGGKENIDYVHIQMLSIYKKGRGGKVLNTGIMSLLDKDAR